MPPSTPRASAYPNTNAQTHNLAHAIRELRECITIFDRALTNLHNTHSRELRTQAAATAQRISVMAEIVERHHTLNTTGGTR